MVEMIPSGLVQIGEQTFEAFSESGPIDAQKRELKVKSGVRVESVEGAAARAGVREGDVVLSLDNTEVMGAKQFEALVGKIDKSKAVTVLVRRGDVVNFLIIRPAK